MRRSAAMHVVHVNREAGVIGDAAHELVGEEDRDERNPVAKEEPGSPQEDRDKEEGDRQDVGVEFLEAAPDHERHDEDGVRADGDHQPPLVANPKLAVLDRRHALLRPPPLRGEV